MKRSNLFKRSAAMLLAGLMAVSMSACGRQQRIPAMTPAIPRQAAAATPIS